MPAGSHILAIFTETGDDMIHGNGLLDNLSMFDTGCCKLLVDCGREITVSGWLQKTGRKDVLMTYLGIKSLFEMISVCYFHSYNILKIVKSSRNGKYCLCLVISNINRMNCTAATVTALVLELLHGQFISP